MATGICLKCKQIGEMTEDHILPKWFRKALPNFGLKPPPLSEIQLVCKKCNGDKAGKIDYTHVQSRDYMKKIAMDIITEVRKFEEFTI